MGTPRVLWIRHLENSPTANIGTFTGLNERFQFLGTVVGVPVEAPAQPSSSKANQPGVRWHTVLHRFRLSGAYVGTDSWASPEGVPEDEGLAAAREHLVGWLGSLRNVSYQDIHIRAFSTTIAGTVFGLVRGEGGQALMLQPDHLSFHAPWSGYHEELQAAGRA